MEDNQLSQFYRSEVFEMTNKRLDRIEEKLDSSIVEIAKINAKFSYVLGIAAGITMALNIAWLFFKEKILKI